MRLTLLRAVGLTFLSTILAPLAISGELLHQEEDNHGGNDGNYDMMTLDSIEHSSILSCGTDRACVQNYHALLAAPLVYRG